MYLLFRFSLRFVSNYKKIYKKTSVIEIDRQNGNRLKVQWNKLPRTGNKLLNYDVTFNIISCSTINFVYPASSWRKHRSCEKWKKKSSFDWFARYTVTTIAYNEIARKYKGKTIEIRGKKKNETFDRKRNDSKNNIIFVMISFHRGGSART